MKKRKNIYALFIAIDAYPSPVRGLGGCVNDVEALHAYLKVHFNNKKYAFHPVILKNEAATRQRVIKGFTHFDQAQTDDICVFHFSGHGSQQAAPKAFWHLEADRQNESILCYDSRQVGGRDLIDKEISYLIWKATKAKNVHFLVLMDCCHAGTNSRLQNVKMRMEKAADQIIPVTDYLGFADYKEVEPGYFTPPTGRHIHFAAAKATETAKEVYTGYQTHGVFTYSLLETLKTNGNKISYQQLAARVNLKVKNLMRDQSPQLETTLPEDKLITFLTGEPADTITHYLVSYDTIGGWTVNAGALHGFQKGDMIKLVNENHAIEVQEVLPATSKVSDMADFDPSQIYDAIVKKRQQPKAIIAFAKAANAEAKRIFYAVYEKNGSDIIELVNNPLQAAYTIHTAQNQYKLTLPNDERPIFFPVTGYTLSTATDFINKIEKVIQWQRLLNLENPASSIGEQALKLTFRKLTQPGQYEDDTPAEIINWHKTIHLPYLFVNKTAHNPAFQLQIKNNSYYPLWISALYLGSDFSIENAILPATTLPIGTDTWLTHLQKNYAHRSMITEVNDRLLKNGITTASELIKIIVSTEEINTSIFNQKGFYDEPLSFTRAQSRNDLIKRPDWRTYTLNLKIFRPMQPQPISSAASFHKLGVRIEVSTGFSAKVRFANVEEIGLALNTTLNINLPQGDYYTPYEFHSGLHYTAGFSVIELFDVHQASSDPSITITFDKLVSKNILPLAYNLKKNCFFILKHSWNNKSLVIEELPEFSAAFPSGLSSKVFFHITNEQQ